MFTFSHFNDEHLIISSRENNDIPERCQNGYCEIYTENVFIWSKRYTLTTDKKCVVV